jgi:hypothetical protein
METSAETLINSELGAGERLLWSGRPRQGLLLRRADVLLVPFSLMWGGFAFFWEYSVFTEGAPVFFRLWGIPFVLVGLYMIAGRFFLEAKQRETTFYAVTNQRILIVSGIWSRRIKSLNTRSLSDISLDQTSDDRGTITFGPANPFSTFAPGAAWPGMPQVPSFDSIADARSVYETIRRTQAAAT